MPSRKTKYLLEGLRRDPADGLHAGGKHARDALRSQLVRDDRPAAANRSMISSLQPNIAAKALSPVQ